jgi:hypothetical protein
MKWIAKIIGLLFILAGIVVAGFTVEVAKKNLDSIPVLLAPVEEAEAQAKALMEAVAQGDYSAAETFILGNPKLGVDRDPADTVGIMIWNAFVESYSYEMVGDCYATDSGIAQNVKVSFLDISSVTKNLRERSQALLEARVAEAVDVDEIYDENNDYKEEFVMAVLKDAVTDALQEDAKMTGTEFTMNLVYCDGNWVVVSDSALMAAISGNVVK